MKQTLWQWIVPEQIPDEEQSYMRSVIANILRTSLILTGLILCMGLLSHALFTTLTAGLAAALSAGLLWLTRRGSLTIVRFLTPAFAFGIATYTMTMQDGVYDEGVLVYPLALTLAGLLLGKRGIVFYTLLTLGTITAIGSAEISGLLATSFQRPTLDLLLRIILLDLLLSFTAALLYLIIANLTHSLKQTRRLHNQAQQELAQRIRAEEEIRTILKTAHDGFSLIDKDGRFLEVNDAYCRMLGYSREEFLHLTIAAINPTYQSPADAVRRIEQIKQAGGSLFESQLRRKDGQIVTVEVSVNYLDIAGGRFFAFIRDISARKQAEQALQDAKADAEFANRAKTNFLCSVSHELRTPLNHILGFGQILEEQLTNAKFNSKHLHYISRILTSGNHLLSLIDDVLTLSRLDLRDQSFERSKILLRTLLEKSLTNLRAKDVKQQLSFAILLPPELDTEEIIADPRALKQILFQLLSNAVKFTPDGGTIVLDAEQQEGKIIIGITDSGIGIAPKQQAHIFENFYQVQSGLVGKTPGTGLGLTIVRRLVELHGGTLWVESEGEGKGCRFSFSLPS